MKDRSWSCSVTRTCLKNTVLDPAGIQERSQEANLASSKGTSRQAEAMPTPTIDQSVTTKEGVDALNTLMLRKLAKESFLSGVPRKAGDSGESHCHKKASTWEALREARSTAVSCKCGSHLGKELISTFPNHHNNTMYTDTTKDNPASFDGGKVTEGVGSLLSRIGLDNRKKPESELLVFQNSSRFHDKVPQHRTFVSTQDFLKSIPSKDAGECQGAVTHSSSREFLSISTEQVTSTSRTTMVKIFAEKNTSHCCAVEEHSVGLSGADLREGTVKERSKHVSWAKEISVSIGSAGRSYNEENDQELFYESEMTEGLHARILGQKLDANEMITNPQASNFKSSMHTVGHMWCIPEANSVADAMCTEFSPPHRCSANGHEETTASRSNPTRPLSSHDVDFDELAPLENNFLKPHLNSPVDKEAALEEVINQSPLPNATTKDMQLRIIEARDLYSSRSKQHTGSPLVGRELIRKIFRDEGEETTVSSKTSWPERLKTAAHVRWNLRELMQREEIEDDVDAKLNALRTAYMPKQGSEELGSVEELARSLVEKQNDAKQEDSVGRGTPQRLQLGIAKLKHEEAQLDDVSLGDSKTEPNATPRSQLTEERTIKGVQVLEGKIARRASLQHNHVHSSCPGDNGRNADTDEKDDELFQGKASSPDTRKLVKLHDSRVDSAAPRELEVDWGTGRDDLEVLLEFLTMKQQLRENKQSNVEVVVQTEAIVRELLSRMKLDSDCSSSVDSDASACFHPKVHVGEPVMDDGHCEGGRKRREQGRSILSTVVTNDAPVRDMSEDSVNSQAVSVHQNPKIDCQSRSAIRRPPFVVPSSSKPHSFQRMTESTSIRKSTSCVRHCCDLSEEYRVTTSPSRTPEEARKRSRRSSGGARQAVESRRNIQSGNRNVSLPAQKHVIDVAAEEVVSVGSQSNVPKGGSSQVTGMETVDGTSGRTRPLGNAANEGITLSDEISGLTSSQTEVLHGSPTGDAMLLHSARILESRTFGCSSPARTPLNYQREQQLPGGRNVQLASPVKRSTPKSPSSPHRRPCRDSPTRKSSPNNWPSPMRSPQRQQKLHPATATLASQVGSPKPTKTLISKDVADDMSYTLISKPSQDVDIFPAGISEAVVQQSIALAKDSSDPYADFRDSMLEMMQEKNLWQRDEELHDLLQCFLHLNQPVHHQLIHQAFSDVVSFGSPMRYRHKSSKRERSKAHPSHRSSPSRSPSRQLWNVSQRKSPARVGG